MTPEEQFKNLATAAESLHPIIEDVGGPVGLLGRVIGMGESELRTGVPRWALFTIGALGGAAVAYAFRRKLEAVFEAD